MVIDGYVILLHLFHFRVVMKDVSEFFRTTAVSKLEFHDGNVDDLISEGGELEARGMHRNLRSADDDQNLR